MVGWHIVRICWISAADGGRKAPPSGPIYATVARFIVADQSQDWSVVLKLEQMADESNDNKGYLRFLANDAPAYLLDDGAEFVLVEGHKVVARGRVLTVNAKPKQETAAQRLILNAAD